MEEWRVLKERYQQLEQATGSCPKVQAWKQAACRRHRGWARFPMRDKRELITGLLPFNENDQCFEIQHTKGLIFQYLYLQHWQNQIQPGSFAIKAEVLFLHCPGLRQGDQTEGSEPGWAASHLPGSDLHRPHPSEAVCHHTRLDVAVPRGKWRCALFSLSRAHPVTKKETEAARGFRQATHLHASPRLPVVLPVSQLRISLACWLMLVTACDDRSCTSGRCHPQAQHKDLRCGPQASLGAVSAWAWPSFLLILALCWSPSYAGTTPVTTWIRPGATLA